MHRYYVGYPSTSANLSLEHTYLVTETGVEVLTARTESSPGGPVPVPSSLENGANGTNGANGSN